MRNSIRFSPRMNRWFYSIFGILFFSGAFWLLAHYFGPGSDELGADNPVKPNLMKIHGAAAMASLVVLGVLIPSHMRRAWTERRNRLAAIFLAGACILLTLSGYGLYYLGGENTRVFTSGVHSIIGCLLPLVLIWHILSGRKSRLRSR